MFLVSLLAGIVVPIAVVHCPMSRHQQSIERARTALLLLILVNVLIYAYRDNFRPHLNLRRTYRIIDGNVRSMLLSIFYHAEPSHLLMNMLALYKYGSELFINTTSSRWRSVYIIVLSYIICGIGAFVGVELLSQYHDYQWEQKVNNAKYANKCTHWFCTSLNTAFGGKDISSLFTNTWAELTTSIEYADVRFSMFYYQMVYRIGASGVVYGWMGMRLITSWISSFHSRLNALDYFFVLATIAHDLGESALSIDNLRMMHLLEGNGIDHAAHVMGTISGMIWAMVFVFMSEKLPLLHWKWWIRTGSGRRLGSMQDEELRIQEQRQQQRQRTQNSRLLTPSQRQRNERTRL